MNSGIMAGAFSPDYTHLLLGDAEGSIMLRGLGHEDVAIRNCEKFKLVSANRGPEPVLSDTSSEGVSQAAVKPTESLLANG